jgi:tetratricopeptide (TPR) repeat protein/cellulose biosynthesis protein BcsQ
MVTPKLARISTFYSYKGGVGRSFLVANVAATLASWGHRVLCLDWDLEAPGLAHYFGNLVQSPASRGLLDLAEDVRSGGRFDWRDVTVIVRAKVSGSIDFISAGSSQDYERRVQDLDWERLYADHGFGELLELARSEMKESYDSVLIDSRTGVSDIGGICAVQLPDVLYMVLAANQQNLDGTDSIASRVQRARDELEVDRLALPIVPILSRFDAREERQLASEWQTKIADRLERHMTLWMPEGAEAREFVQQAIVPYVAYWSFGEGLPVLYERSTDPESISWSIETIAAIVANGPEHVDELLASRDRFISKARGSSVPEHVYDIYVSSGALDATEAIELTAAFRRLGFLTYCPVEQGATGADWRLELGSALSNSLNLVVLVEGSLRRDQVADVRTFLSQLVERTTDSRIVVVNLGTQSADLPSILLDRAVIPWRSVEKTTKEVVAALGLDAKNHTRLEQVVRERELMLGADHPDTITTRYNVATQLAELGRYNDALKVGTQVLADRERILGRDHANTLAARNNVARFLRTLGRYDDALALAEQTVSDGNRVLRTSGEEEAERSGGSDRTLVDVAVAGALRACGLALLGLGRHKDALKLWEELIERYAGANEPAIGEHVAAASFNKGVNLAALGRREEALAAYNEVIERFGDFDEPEFRQAFARASYNKGLDLAALGRREEALAAYDQLIERFADSDEPALREQVAKASFNKGVELGASGRSEEALAAYDQLIERFADSDEPTTRQQVAKASFNKGVELATLGRRKEARSAYDQLIERYALVDDSIIRDLVSQAQARRNDS